MTHDKSTVLGISAKWIVTASFLAAGCEPAAPAAPAAAPPPVPPPILTEAQPEPAAVAPIAIQSAPVKPTMPEAIVLKNAGWKTPESVLYDADADEYFVSNINGRPTDADDNGFISRLDATDGKIIDLAFIDGAKKEITLNAPKGMALIGDVLYVADIDVVRSFDKKTGKAKGEIRVPKATFLNDISVSRGGKLFVSDSGLKWGKEALEPNGSDAVFIIDTKTGKPTVIRANKDLLGPNGVLADEDGAFVVTFGGAELYRLDMKGAREQITTLPQGGLDGIVRLPDGTFLVSSWDAGAVFRGRPGGTFEPIITGLTSPADIGIDSKRNRVLIPEFKTDTVVLQPLPTLAPIPEPAPTTAAVAKPAVVAATESAAPAAVAKPAVVAATESAAPAVTTK